MSLIVLNELLSQVRGGRVEGGRRQVEGWVLFVVEGRLFSNRSCIVTHPVVTASLLVASCPSLPLPLAPPPADHLSGHRGASVD